MRPTRRFWAVVGLGLALVGLAVLFDRPVLLVGAAGVGAWILAVQVAFVRSLVAIDRAAEVEHTLSRSRARTGAAVLHRVAITIDRGTPLALRIEAPVPVGASAPDGPIALALERGETTVEGVTSLEWPIAGRFGLDPPTFTAVDATGCFVESFQTGPTPAIRVEPPAPRDVHVGEGGTPVAAAYGEHTTTRFGSGLEPEEIREYFPGDPANRIDWNATARLGRPLVREFEPESDRRTVLVVDHRSPTAAGVDGETVLDYLRFVSLGLVENARRLGDPVGLASVGGAGVTGWRPPATSAGDVEVIRRRLLDLEADRSSEDSRPSVRTSSAAAAQAAAALEADSSAFAARLRPFYADRVPYLERTGADPLVSAIRGPVARIRGTVWTAILTDDSERTAVREAVKLARRGGDAVLVFLAPQVLFERGGLADLEAAYDRYRDFEVFRRELGGLDRVTALEVAPGDRLDAVLKTRRYRDRLSSPQPEGATGA